eukprot:gene6768-7867_t
MAPAQSEYPRMRSIWTRLMAWCRANDQMPYLAQSLLKPAPIFGQFTEQRSLTFSFEQRGRLHAAVNRSLSAMTSKSPPEIRTETVTFPADYIASMYLFNGQQANTPYGLFGTILAYEITTNIILMDFDHAKAVYIEMQHHHASNRNLWPVARSNRRVYFMVINQGTVIGDVQHTPGQIILSSKYLPTVVANSFAEFLETMVVGLETSKYTLRENIISRFPEHSQYIVETETQGVRIKGSAVYAPEDSRPDAPMFFYRITISMDKDADPNLSCRLLSRHWEISESNSPIVQVVDGPGVIGLFPEISPGTVFEYTSKCPMENRSGVMSGHFEMEPLNGIFDGPFNAIIAPFTLTMEQH